MVLRFLWRFRQLTSSSLWIHRVSHTEVSSRRFLRMENYLDSVKTSLTDLSNFSCVHIVLGNEACDLDSAVCALTYAFYLSKVSKEKANLVLPLLNIPQSQYHIRTEIKYFLKNFHIQADDLIFRDQIDFEKLAISGQLRLTLVDHHVLTGTLADYDGHVIKIIDHRVRERPDKPGVSVKIDLVGSCCTLVAEELLNDPDFVVDEVVAELLFGTILVDTVNRLPEAGKITARDNAVLDRLKSLIPAVDGDKLYACIQAAKTDMSDLTNMDILEKDLKMVSGTDMTIAMSSVTMDMQELLSRPDFEEDLKQFCDSKTADVAVIMTMSTDKSGQPARQLAVFSTNRIYRDQISDALKNNEEVDLSLSPLQPYFEDLIVCCQGNVKASRKKVMPIIKTFLKKKY